MRFRVTFRVRQENTINAINANATKTVHEANSVIAIARFMNGVLGTETLLHNA